MARVLLVDDEPNILKVLGALLSSANHEPVGVQSGEEALTRIQEGSFDVAICDLRLGRGMTGLDLLHEIRARQVHLPVIMITAYGTIEVAVQAMKEGAFDFVRKPFKMDELLHTVESALRHRQVNEKHDFPTIDHPERHFGLLIGESEAMGRVYDLVERVARTDTTVLIQGESGTGKELVAHAIHRCSRRAQGPWVPLNCAALPAPLLESEIFGHAAGAFTGATQTRDGLFLAAAGGTLFLDEIGAMDLGIQSKFLRALQDRRVRRVGENEDVPIDVRVIAATNESLEAKKDSGAFREDLYYRISVIPVVLPPLRQRVEDVPLLVGFLCAHQTETIGHLIQLGEGVLEALTEYSWPGNVRELENAIACAAALSPTGQIQLADLPPSIARCTPSAGSVRAGADGPVGISLRNFLREKEKEYMQMVLARTEGNRARAAELLGISRATFYRKLPEA